MRLNRWTIHLVTTVVLAGLSATTVMAVPSQRANTCVVMDVAEGQVEGKQYRWDFELTIPGSYVVQYQGRHGAFIDQMHGFAWLRADKSADVQKAMGDMMALLKTENGAGQDPSRQ